MRPQKILIIGAGIAGLAAASRLVAAGLSVVILEARDRIGGRIHTLRDGPTPIEAGPEFIHGATKELRALMRQADAIAVPVPNRLCQLSGGVACPIEFDGSWGKVLEVLENTFGTDESFAQFLARSDLQLSPVERNLAIDYVEGFNAADQHDVSRQWLQASETEIGVADDEIQRLTSGYDAIVGELQSQAKGLRLELNARVTALRWQPGQVEIDVVQNEKVQRTETGDAVIVTLPLGVLLAERDQLARVEFIPDLPEKRFAAQQLRMGAVVKVVLRFATPFWKERGLIEPGFLHLPGSRFMTCWPFDDSGVITVWSGGPRAIALSALDDDAIFSAALADLARVFDMRESQLIDQLTERRVFNWQKDPFALGAYSYAAVDGRDAFKALAEPVADTVFFAGEATDDKIPATVTGALRSGYRAAEEVMRVGG